MKTEPLTQDESVLFVTENWLTITMITDLSQIIKDLVFQGNTVS